MRRVGVGVVMIAGLLAPVAPAHAEAAWQQGPPMLQARVGHVAVTLHDGRVLVAGGSTQSGLPTASAELLDPVTMTWSATTPMRNARSHAAAVVLASGKVLVVGGGSTAELFDPASRVWSSIGSPRIRGSGHTATLLADGRVLVVGGCCEPTGAQQSWREVDVYDPARNTWTVVTPTLERREGHTATLLADGRVLVVGGPAGTYALSGVPSVDAGEIFYPATNRWTAVRPNPHGYGNERFGGHTASRLADGSVLITGGCCLRATEATCVQVCVYGNPTDPTLRFEPVINAWIPVGQELPRFLHAAAVLRDGRVLVAGGRHHVEGIASPSTESTMLFDPVTQLWTAGPDLPDPVERAVSVVLADGQVLLIGGRPADDARVLATTVLFSA